MATAHARESSKLTCSKGLRARKGSATLGEYKANIASGHDVYFPLLSPPASFETVHSILGSLIPPYRQEEVLTAVRQIPPPGSQVSSDASLGDKRLS
jgi:hypothetical protein